MSYHLGLQLQRARISLAMNTSILEAGMVEFKTSVEPRGPGLVHSSMLPLTASSPLLALGNTVLTKLPGMKYLREQKYEIHI